jgi:RNA polymerase sigma-32 factor
LSKRRARRSETAPAARAGGSPPAPRRASGSAADEDAPAEEPSEEPSEEPDDLEEPDEPEADELEEPVAPAPSPRSLVPLSGGATADALTHYFQEISRYPLLEREQEHELAVRVHEQGDRDAAQTLVLSNLRLVVRIALEYRRVWTNLLDLIQEGNVGLLQAVRRFDPYRGVKLSSYSAYWIRAYILKYLIDNVRTVRLGSSRAERKIFYSLSRARRELERQGFTPTPALLAERLDVATADVESVQQRLAQSDVSLDAPLSSADPGGATLGDRQSSAALGTDEAVSTREMQQAFRQHVERFGEHLDARESAILRDRMLADEPVTLQEIGERFGLTRERVRQIEKKLVGRLRDYLKENLVDFDYWAPED